MGYGNLFGGRRRGGRVGVAEELFVFIGKIVFIVGRREV